MILLSVQTDDEWSGEGNELRHRAYTTASTDLISLFFINLSSPAWSLGVAQSGGFNARSIPRRTNKFADYREVWSRPCQPTSGFPSCPEFRRIKVRQLTTRMKTLIGVGRSSAHPSRRAMDQRLHAVDQSSGRHQKLISLNCERDRRRESRCVVCSSIFLEGRGGKKKRNSRFQLRWMRLTPRAVVILRVRNKSTIMIIDNCYYA